MSKQSLIDSLPVGSQVTDGKDPMRDLPIGGRRPYTPAQQEDPYEAQMVRALRTWMKNPTAPSTLEILSKLMLAHEIRAYNTMAQTK